MYLTEYINIPVSPTMRHMNTRETSMILETTRPSRKTRHLLLSRASREAVLESLGTLGETQKKAIIFMLKRDYKVDLHAPINDLNSIFDALKGLFGEGAPFLIDLITRNLSTRVPR